METEFFCHWRGSERYVRPESGNGIFLTHGLDGIGGLDGSVKWKCIYVYTVKYA